MKDFASGSVESSVNAIRNNTDSAWRHRALATSIGLAWLLGRTGTVFAQPAITSQPTDQTVNQGFSATFQVRATGSAPLTYQWRFNSVVIDGATTNSLTISNALPTNAGDYSALVSDPSGSVTSRVARLTVVAPAALASKVLTNFWFGAEPPNLPTNRLGQVEPHIARSFRDPKLLAAAWMEGKHTDDAGGSEAIGYAKSEDGGATWLRGMIPHLTTNTGGPFARAADPVVAFDADDNLYVCTIAGTKSATNYPVSLLISRMANGGITFEPPVTVFRTTNRFPTTDKPWLSVNGFRGSPTVNRLAIAWIEFNYDASGNEIGTKTFLALSDDHAATWTAPGIIATNAMQPTPVFLPDGALTVFYNPFQNWSRIDVAVSTDGGTNFNYRGRVASYSPYFASNIRQSGAAAVATSRTTGFLYVAFQADVAGVPRIQFTRSIDQGRSWGTAVTVSDTPNRRPVFNPALAVSPDGLHVLIVFCDQRHDSGSGSFLDYYLAESFNGGFAWEPNTRLTEFSSDLRRAPNANGYMLGDYHGVVPAVDLQSPAWAAVCDTRSGNADPVLIAIQRTRGVTYENWAGLWWGGIGVIGRGFDRNALEYLCGLNPFQSHENPFVVQQGRSDQTESFAIRYPVQMLIQDLRLTWESSGDLVTWSPATPASHRETRIEGTSLFDVEDAFPITPDANRFFRLRLELR